MANFGFESVPFFNGEGDAENFIQYYELESVKKDWNDAKKCKVIEFCLTGVAKQAFNMLTDEDKKDFSKISKHLIEKCSKPTDICIKEFQERIMKADESPAQLAIELEKLVKRAYPKLDKTSQQVTMQHHFLKCLPVHVRSVVRGGMSKLEWSEVVSLADQVFKDYIPNGQGVELETKIQVEGELNRINVNESKRRGKFNGNCNFCGIYGHKEVECRKKRGRMSVTNNNGSRFNFNNYNNDRSKTFSRKQSDKVESFNAKAYTVQLNNTQKELDELEQFNMLELKTSVLEQRVNLIRVNGLAKLTGTKNGCTLSMLVDGGASHSFINMNVLPQQIVEQIENGSSSLDVVKREYSLEMATETRTISCYIGRFLIKIDEWIGEQLFVVSRDLSSE